MVASTKIKWFTSDNLNAPQLTNDWGVMIDVLDACLINGMSVQTVASLTASGAVATATFNSAHQYKQYQVIEISGAAQAEYNVQARILTVPNANSITFELLAAPVVTTATGAITCKLPPLGFEKPFSSSGGAGKRAAYRSSNLLLPSRPFLRVVDELDPAYNASYAKYAKVGIVEDMTDINTMLGVQAPFDSANPDKNWVATGSGTTVINGWAKWYYARSADFIATSSDTSTPASGIRSWLLVGTSDRFYILPVMTSVSAMAACYGFGAFDSLLSVDNANNFLGATTRAVSVSTGDHKADWGGLTGTATGQITLLQRGYKQTASYTEARTLSLWAASSIFTGSADYIGARTLAGISPFAPVVLNEVVLRGILPDIYWLFQKQPYADREVIVQSSNVYIAINIASGSNAAGQIILGIGGL